MEKTDTTVCPKCVESMAKAEECIRRHPTEAALISLGTGFVMAQLPLRVIAAVVVQMLLLMVKPAVLLYGFYRVAENYHPQPHRENPPAAPV